MCNPLEQHTSRHAAVNVPLLTSTVLGELFALYGTATALYWRVTSSGLSEYSSSSSSSTSKSKSSSGSTSDTAQTAVGVYVISAHGSANFGHAQQYFVRRESLCVVGPHLVERPTPRLGPSRHRHIRAALAWFLAPLFARSLRQRRWRPASAKQPQAL